jgi:hypothetical protein
MSTLHFPTSKTIKCGYRGICRVCNEEYMNGYYQQNKERIKESRKK